MSNKVKICKVCASESATNGPRCLACHRVFKAEHARTLRAKNRKKALKDNVQLEKTGWKRCSKCLKKRQLSEYATSQSRGRGKRNSICDACLTSIYTNKYRLSADKDIGSINYWRRRAYCTNTAARARLARIRSVKVSEISLFDLVWVCKPQDLVKLFEEQRGVCGYCGISLEAANIHVDHKKPLSADGEHVYSNIQLTCSDCNRLKHTRDDTAFRKFMSDYASRILTKEVTEAKDKEP